MFETITIINDTSESIGVTHVVDAGVMGPHSVLADEYGVAREDLITAGQRTVFVKTPGITLIVSHPDSLAKFERPTKTVLPNGTERTERRPRHAGFDFAGHEKRRAEEDDDL